VYCIVCALQGLPAAEDPHTKYMPDTIVCEESLFQSQLDGNVTITRSSHLPLKPLIAIQITPFWMHLTLSYTTTMDSTASESPDLDSEARIELAVAYSNLFVSFPKLSAYRDQLSPTG
jgi:hypothetical protein